MRKDFFYVFNPAWSQRETIVVANVKCYSEKQVNISLHMETGNQWERKLITENQGDSNVLEGLEQN